MQLHSRSSSLPCHLPTWHQPVGFPGSAEGLCSLAWGFKSTLTEAASDFSCCVTSGGWEGILFQAVIGFQTTMRLSVFLNSSVTSVLLSFSCISAVLVLCSGLKGKTVPFRVIFSCCKMELLDGISVLSGTVPSWTGTGERGFEGKEIESEPSSHIMGIWRKVSVWGGGRLLCLHLEVIEQLVLFESLHGAGASKGSRKWKKQQVGAVGGDVCDFSKAACCAAAWGLYYWNQKQPGCCKWTCTNFVTNLWVIFSELSDMLVYFMQQISFSKLIEKIRLSNTWGYLEFKITQTEERIKSHAPKTLHVNHYFGMFFCNNTFWSTLLAMLKTSIIE